MTRLTIRAVALRGNCPVYEIGDQIIIDDGFRLNLAETDAVCMHSLASFMPYYVALSKGVTPAQLGLADERGLACVQCLDPAECTGGGTVLFEMTVEDVPEGRPDEERYGGTS